MLRNTIKKWALLPVVAMLCAATVKAQEFNTNESISEQLKKGRVPGLRYGSEPVKPMKAEKNEDHSESSIAKIRKGTAQGMNFARGQGAARPATKRMARTSGGQKLASEQDMKPATQQSQANIKPAVVPGQGNVKEPSLEYKAPVNPAKKTELAPAVKAKEPVKKD